MNDWVKEWVNMPEYVNEEQPKPEITATFKFRNEQDYLLFKEKETAEKLANNIAIKGGTTEAALNQFKNNKILHRIFKKVVKAA